MKFVDLDAQQQRLKAKLDDRIQQVLAHGKYVMGPEVAELEEQLAGYVGAPHAIGCASGTDALMLALMAYGVGPGDAVFTTPFTFIASAEVISLLGATPVFVDIEAATFNLDPEALSRAVAAVAGPDPGRHPLPGHRPPLKPRGIIGVDLFGLPADYDRVKAVAAAHDLFVIEDAAQSFGAQYQGRRAGSLGHIAGTSFFPAKPLGCYGDGGMCFTHDAHLAEVIRSLRVHGQGHDKYDNVRIGVNGRLDTLQAAILLAKFTVFPEEVELRQQVARRYGVLLGSVAGLQTPAVPAGYLSVWAQYSLLAAGADHRAAIQARLKEEGIPTAIYYPKPLHLQTAFSNLGYKAGDFPVSEDCAQRIFSLPMHPYLQAADQENLAAILRQA